MPLTNRDYAVLSRPFASAVLPMAVAPFVDLLRQTLVEKFPEIAPHEAAASIFGRNLAVCGSIDARSIQPCRNGISIKLCRIIYASSAGDMCLM